MTLKLGLQPHIFEYQKENQELHFMNSSHAPNDSLTIHTGTILHCQTTITTSMGTTWGQILPVLCE